MTTGKFTDFKPFRNLHDKAALQLYKENPCQFMEEQIVLTRNAITGGRKELVKLEPFQEEIVDSLLGTRNRDGHRYYDEAVLSMGKKNAKSSLASMIFAFLFFMDYEESEYVFSSNSKDQSNILAYGNFTRICLNNPNFRKLTQIHKSYVERNDIPVKAFPVPYTEAANHGFMDLAGIHFDEPWGYPDDSLFTAFTKNFTKKEFLSLSTSYAGFDKRSCYYQLCNRAKQGISPQLYYKSFEAREDSPEFWKDANPASWVTMEELHKQKNKLIDSQFKRMHLNMWVDSNYSGTVQQFVTEDHVKSITRDDLAPTEIGNQSYKYVCGVDLGLSHDNTAIAVMHRENDLIYLDRLDVWTGSKGNEVNISMIEKYMIEMKNRYNCVFVIDPWQMKSTLQKFEANYGKDVVKEFSFRGKYTELTEMLCRVIKAKELQLYPDAGIHYDNKGMKQTLQQELVDLYVKFLPNNTIRFDHESTKKSDMTVAIAVCIMELVSTAPLAEHHIWRM